MPAPRVIGPRQLEIILEYMKTNRDLAVGRRSNATPLGKQEVQHKWEALALELNSVGVGTTKTTARWREYWSELKYAVRKKCSELRRYALGTGGGPQKVIRFSHIEKQILEIMGEELVHGNPSVCLPFNENSTERSDVKIEETRFEVVEAQDGDPLESFLQSSGDESSQEVPPPPKKVMKVLRTDLAQASSSKKVPDQKVRKNSTIFKAEAASSPNHGNREDQFDLFGKNVASKLRNIAQNDNTQRLMAEKIVNDALFFAEMGQLTLAHCNKLHSA